MKEELKSNYNISIDDIHKFARVIYEFSKSGYDATYILKEFLKVWSMKFEIVALKGEIKQLEDKKISLKSTLKFEKSGFEEDRQSVDLVHQLKNINFGSDMLKQLRDILLEVARVKKQSIKEVSIEFINDINRYYY